MGRFTISAGVVLLLCLLSTRPPVLVGSQPVVGGRIDPKTAALRIKGQLEPEVANLVGLYKHFHAHPELAFTEKETMTRLAKELKDLGCAVTTGVGKTGVVGLLRNGSGPVVMVRADMDGLPIMERTGLAYASKVRVRDGEGREIGVMHSCGHDIKT